MTTGFTTTSSGKIVATLNDLTQSFTGSTGQDIITISADATKAITGGSATNNEVVFNATAGTFNATAANLTNTNVTGFTVFGLGANSGTGTWDLASFNSTFNAVDITNANAANNVANTITRARAHTRLNIDGSTMGPTTDSGSVSLSYADTTGASDTSPLTIGAAGKYDTSIATVACRTPMASVSRPLTSRPWDDVGNTAERSTPITTALIDNGFDLERLRHCGLDDRRHRRDLSSGHVDDQLVGNRAEWQRRSPR